MSGQYPNIEQDPNLPGAQGDALPTYEDLSAQSGPNSRFGRWRGWIEKRAAERYDAITPEDRARRRERGWGNSDMDPALTNAPASAAPSLVQPLFIQTDFDGSSYSPTPTTEPPESPALPPLPFVSQTLSPTHLKLNQFGSRFLPHATSPIRCLLPLPGGKLLLIGHDQGMSVLDLFPQEWNSSGGISSKGPDEAQARQMWEGEVHQMSLLEVEDTGGNTPQGVVLMLVGPPPDSSSPADNFRVLRMYNLGSLTSLAKWTVAQKGACQPLNLQNSSGNSTNTIGKKHRPQNSITRGLKNLTGSSHVQPSSSSYQKLLSPSGSFSMSNFGSSSSSRSSPSSGASTPMRSDSTNSWNIVDDLPIRWATDFVPLASPGSRLLNLSVGSYALWHDENRKGKGGQFLAVATKSTILLYETPRGERAFRYVKEFYTPLQPRKVEFFQQAVHDFPHSGLSEAGARHHSHGRSDSVQTVRSNDGRSATPSSTYGPQLSIFIVFDKKAGWIRLADSAVGEIDMYEEGANASYHALPRESLTPSRRSRISFDGFVGQAKWTTPVLFELPVVSSEYNAPATKTVYLLTKGKKTHIVPHPLPTNVALVPPLAVFSWLSPPTSVSPRICHPEGDLPPYLQLISLGERGLEVQETSLSFLNSKGKGKSRSDNFVRASEDVGGPTGYLCGGGHWDFPDYPFQPPPLVRTASVSSTYSADSFDSFESGEHQRRLAKQQGMYAWCCKGLEDYRVFWVGGSHSNDET